MQGKRFGHEITFFSVWFELRWGIVACLMLTVSLITMIFYFHPSTHDGDVVLQDRSDHSAKRSAGSRRSTSISARRSSKGDVIFKLDNSKQEAALETARRKIAEVDASMLAAQADVLKAEGQLQEAKSALQQAQDELDTKRELQTTQPRHRATA